MIHKIDGCNYYMNIAMTGLKWEEFTTLMDDSNISVQEDLAKLIADVGNFQVFYAVVFIIHGLKPPFVLVRNIDACKTAKFAFFAVFLLSVYTK